MKYNLVYKLLFVETNVNKIYYFSYAPVLDSLISGKTKYGLRFLVKDDVKKPEFLNQPLDYFWGSQDKKVIYYEHPIIPGVKAKMLLDMRDKVYLIVVNTSYYKLSKYRFENVWPPGQHLTSLINIKLLENNILTLHAAAISDKKTDKGYLLIGASETGKSYTTFRAIKNGYHYHSEDLTILDRESIYTTPLISGLSDKLPSKNIKLKYNLFTSKLLGFNLILPRLNDKSSFREFMEKFDLKKKSKIDKIFILEKKGEGAEKIGKKEALRKILILNRLELTYYRDHLLYSYSYFNKSMDIDGLMKREKELIGSILESAECYLIKANTPSNYFTYINKLIK